MNLVFYMSLRPVPLGIAVALEFTGPLALAGVALLGERFSLLQWLATVTIIVAAAGTALSVRRPMLAEPLAN